MISLSSQVHFPCDDMFDVLFAAVSMFVGLILNLYLQTNELYQLAAVAFCLVVAWVKPHLPIPFVSNISCIVFRILSSVDGLKFFCMGNK